jgi:hypothetical protein
LSGGRKRKRKKQRQRLAADPGPDEGGRWRTALLSVSCGWVCRVRVWLVTWYAGKTREEGGGRAEGGREGREGGKTPFTGHKNEVD